MVQTGDYNTIERLTSPWMFQHSSIHFTSLLRLQSPAFPKELLPPLLLPSDRPFQCSIPPHFAPLPRTPAPGRKIYRRSKKRRRMTLEKEDLNSYVRWLQLLLVRPSEKTR
ncbi:hypothetical protein CDAR_63371 [Caerostris darwini]|uniref:Uncharacterized protein n=1 Tax=Caerostris darwini TaxID=1538125 RepID=A0AAV4QRF0_9ARAC|nr:hypothetical protein CDAR_63371 [Caerostris darwini]